MLLEVKQAQATIQEATKFKKTELIPFQTPVVPPV
jgi:hypothetical protein